MTAGTSTQTLLARHPFTTGMGGPAIEKLASLARNVGYARNEVIFREVTTAMTSSCWSPAASASRSFRRACHMRAYAERRR